MENTIETKFNIKNMDMTKRPQDDFYDFVNGKWMEKTTIPSDQSSWGGFNELREITIVNSLKILNDIVSKTYEANSEGEKIQNLYSIYTNLEKRNKDGIEPIKKILEEIDNINNLTDFQNAIEKLTLEYGFNPLFRWMVEANLADSKNNAVYIDGPQLGLGRDYYQKETEKNDEVLKKYGEFIVEMFLKIGYDKEVAEEITKKIVAFEKEIASYILPNEELRDASKMLNPRTDEQLKTISKNVNLSSYLKNVKVDTQDVIIPEIKYIENIDKFINKENLELIKNYFKLKAITSSASILDEKIEEIQFEFYGKYLTGQREQKSLDKKVYSLIDGLLGEAFGKLYVAEYFPSEYKEKMIELIDYLKKSFKIHLENLNWMSEDTKKMALKKLSSFTVKVGYPDKWEDYSLLKIEKEKSLFENLVEISKWQYNKNLEKVGKPVDKQKWEMTPQTVNAYYNPMNNEIVFPAAILQPPFFYPEEDAALNFGGIGAVIGHEITHGFDDSGCQFDAEGNLKNWWTEEDKKKFDELTLKLQQQYDKYEPVKGHFINGKFTLGENIADLGGVNISFDALKMYLEDKGEVGLINEFTQEQRFYISWATSWRTKATDESLINQVAVDPHSPGRYRAFAPLTNVDGFYNAFDIKEGDKLYKTDENRIKIW